MYKFESADEALANMAWEIMANGHVAETRGGKVRELRHVMITIENPLKREILNPKRKANYAAQIVEAMWVLAGRNDIAGIEPYLKRAPEFSDDGITWRSGYGPRLRSFGDANRDQFRYVLTAIARDPGTRQAVISLWDPQYDGSGTPSKDTACNNWLNFTVRDGRLLDMDIAIRSNDLIWGWSGVNQFEWSVLQEVAAGLLGLGVGRAHYYIANLHIYARHWEKAREIYEGSMPKQDLTPTPRFDVSAISNQSLEGLDNLVNFWFEVEKLIREGDPTAQAEIDEFPESMMREWLRVLQWYWSGRDDELGNTDSETTIQAALLGAKPKAEPKEDPFAKHLTTLHLEKDAAYGDSWKKRGEVFSILPNIARKIDRLGTGQETRDENFADTAGDLLTYLAKYAAWLGDEKHGADVANAVILDLSRLIDIRASLNGPSTVQLLTKMFDQLLTLVEYDGLDDHTAKRDLVSNMLVPAYHLAGAAWLADGNKE